ncbi:MAG: hypothetical protein ACLFVU_07220 [Phycisphaerae bacterium]
MRRTVMMMLLGAGLLSGCGVQETMLGSRRGYLFSGFDRLTVPGRTVEVQTRLQQGDLLDDQPGFVVRYYLDGQLLKVARTNEEGRSIIHFTPESEGDHVLTAELSPNGFRTAPPDPVQILVRAVPAETPLVVVDIDKTLVEAGFITVLIGDPRPLQDSPRVMDRLAGEYSIVYLTHRPDYLSPKSKAFLREHGYPEAPLLLSETAGMPAGSREFKTKRLGELADQFGNMKIGIGDMVSDAQAYIDNDLQAYLIVRPARAIAVPALRALADSIQQLPETVQVVRGWDEVEKGIFDGTRYPKQRVIRWLRREATTRAATQPDVPTQPAAAPSRRSKETDQ